MEVNEWSSNSLEFTPTWILAVVCCVLIVFSSFVWHLIEWSGKTLKRSNMKSLSRSLKKVKAELTISAFMALVSPVFKPLLTRICVSKNLFQLMLPCDISAKSVFSTVPVVNHCSRKNQIPMVSAEAFSELDAFIFVLVVTHLTISIITVLGSRARMWRWKHWEDAIQHGPNDMNQALIPQAILIDHQPLNSEQFLGLGGILSTLTWLSSFFKQFRSITKMDYLRMRTGFIEAHSLEAMQGFDFNKYLMRSLEEDFKHVTGISWYLWIYVAVFLILNTHGLRKYYWILIAFVPLLVLLAVGTKLAHVIFKLTRKVIKNNTMTEGEPVVGPSDDHFWFNRPHLVLCIIHFILFQNAFELSFFLWILGQYGYHSCMMREVRFIIIPKLITGFIVQVLCIYSTLPLYAIVTQMGSHFKPAIFDDYVRECLGSWIQMAKKKKEEEESIAMSDRSVASTSTSSNYDTIRLELGIVPPEEASDEIEEFKG